MHTAAVFFFFFLHESQRTSRQDAGKQRQCFVARETERKRGESRPQAAHLTRRATPAGVRVTHTFRHNACWVHVLLGRIKRQKKNPSRLPGAQKRVFHPPALFLHHPSVTLHAGVRVKGGKNVASPVLCDADRNDCRVRECVCV